MIILRYCFCNWRIKGRNRSTALWVLNLLQCLNQTGGITTKFDGLMIMMKSEIHTGGITLFVRRFKVFLFSFGEYQQNYRIGRLSVSSHQHVVVIVGCSCTRITFYCLQYSLKMHLKTKDYQHILFMSSEDRQYANTFKNFRKAAKEFQSKNQTTVRIE